jgi:hypothetical protein
MVSYVCGGGGWKGYARKDAGKRQARGRHGASMRQARAKQEASKRRASEEE